MRVAVLSDIHANLVALDATLADVRQAQIDTLLLLGDYIGYYYEPAGVIAALMTWPHYAVRGNHDRRLIEAPANPDIITTYRAKYGQGLDVAAATLSPQQRDWIFNLQETEMITLAGRRLLLCHGSPFDPDFYIYPDSAPETLARCASPEVDFVLMGHTHHAFTASISDCLLVNPGSVGQARDLGGFASWSILDLQRNTVTHRRTAYDPAGLIAETRLRDPHLPNNADVLTRRNPLLRAAIDQHEKS